MFWNKKPEDNKPAIQWHELTNVEQIATIAAESEHRPVAIYKHSTRCSVSDTALNRLERAWKEELEPIKMYFLDLIAHRDVSNAVAERFDVAHESPQLIILKNHKPVYTASHLNISVADLKGQVA